MSSIENTNKSIKAVITAATPRIEGIDALFKAHQAKAMAKFTTFIADAIKASGPGPLYDVLRKIDFLS